MAHKALSMTDMTTREEEMVKDALVFFVTTKKDSHKCVCADVIRLHLTHEFQNVFCGGDAVTAGLDFRSIPSKKNKTKILTMKRR